MERSAGAAVSAPSKLYIGDGVYVAFDGYGLTLTTENGISVTNTIYLEPNVYGELTRYVLALREEEKGK